MDKKFHILNFRFAAIASICKRNFFKLHIFLKYLAELLLLIMYLYEREDVDKIISTVR